MATASDFRRLALAQPEAEQKSHFDRPDFRVRNKIFAGLQPKQGLGVLKLPPERMWILTREDEATFSPAKGFERGGWTLIALDRIAVATLQELVPLAWAQVAPKRLQAAAASPARKEQRARPSRRRTGA